jgi:hypothetical protein
MLAIGILIFGIVSRLIVHIPNFTPVMALALFGGVYLKKDQAVLLPVLLMAVTDLFLGLHGTMFFTWGSVALIAVLGLGLRKNKNAATIAGFSLASALLFFVVTNFGVWLVSGMYPRTLAGLMSCYILAIPFFRHTLFSTVIYAFVLFGGYEVVAAQLKKTRLAFVL